MALKDKTEQAKAKQSSSTESTAPAGGGLTPQEREAMLGAAAPENWNKTGNKYLYKADHFAASRDASTGAAKCYREINGQKHYTAPWLYGIPFAIQDAPSDYKEGDVYERIIIQATRPTFVMQGEGENLHDVRVNVGELVMINRSPGTERIAQIALMKDRAIEVACRPTHKGSIKGGKTMWFWDISENPVRIEKVIGPAPTENALEGNPLA